jgi:glycosyltransferase involved in cell wall biosynthesis|tara:strand:- start:649 stop:1437 length:789 start_codon:yes stop_codon:yes gene_type:complete
VDSGSTDETLSIANEFSCIVEHISQQEFTFGLSLNRGCERAKGEFLVFISGHCIPHSEHWLANLCAPLIEGVVCYSYGMQRGRDTTKYSEELLFKKFYPTESQIPQEGFFVNNANAAISRAAWQLFRFDEEITGLEDMYLSKLLVASGEKIGYVADAAVWHIHDENWGQIKTRYERESFALQKVMPEIHFSLVDFCRFFVGAVGADLRTAGGIPEMLSRIVEIARFRFCHYWGTYIGSRSTHILNRERKQKYFYAKIDSTIR